MEKKHLFSLLFLLLIAIGVNAITYPSTSYEFYNGHIMKWTGPETDIDLTADPYLRDHVEDIYSDAFAGNTTLKSIVLTATIDDVMPRAFEGCTSLESVTFSTIGADGWYINEVNIQFSAFKDCTALKTVSFNHLLNYVSEDAFEGCTALTRFSIKNHPTMISSGGVIYTKEKDKLVLFPPGLTGHFDVPSSVIEIEYGAFYNSQISTVYLENVQTIGTSAFEEAYNLTAINFPSSLQTIGKWAFYKCGALKTLILPSSLQTIEDGAFGKCSSLPSTIKLPASLVKISGDAFNRCPTVKRFEVAPGNLYYSTDSEGVLYDYNKDTLVSWPAGKEFTDNVIPDFVSAIGDYAFYYANLQSITIPSSIQSIGEGAFLGSSLTDVSISEGVSVIGENAFSRTNISSIFIPEGVTTIDDAFFACDQLKEIELPSTLTSLAYQTFDYGPSTPRKVICHLLSPVGNWRNPQKDTLYVHEESLALFQMAKGWRDFGDIRPIKELQFFTVSFDQPEHGWLVVVANGDEIESGTIVEENSTIIVTAIATEYPDYVLESLTMNGQAIENNSSFLLKEPTTIEAVFKSSLPTSIEDTENRNQNELGIIYDVSGRKISDAYDGKKRYHSHKKGIYIVRTPNGVKKIKI